MSGVVMEELTAKAYAQNDNSLLAIEATCVNSKLVTQLLWQRVKATWLRS